MKIIKILIAIVLVCLAVGQDAVAITTTYCAIHKTPKQVIHEVAADKNFKQVNLLVKLAEAESGLGAKIEWLDVNGLYSRGLYHMQQGFWAENCIPLFKENEDIFDNKQQTECVINVIRTKGIDFAESTAGWFNTCKKINCKQLWDI